MVNLLPLPPKLQTVADKCSNVFASPIIEFYRMNPCGFLFLYIIFSFPIISRHVDYKFNTKIWIFMLCIHIISILCRVPKRDAELSGNIDIRLGFAQLACELSTVNVIFTSIRCLAVCW